ncbi:hypothetical protein LXA43DRAFT_970789 [Ganoderma leucocontextum]|nr:hypothetical protein LXA43DRAFT_970789 [Ganoderma leucocontextum]
MSFESLTSLLAVVENFQAANAAPTWRVACPDGVHLGLPRTYESLRLMFYDVIGFSPAVTAERQFGGGGEDGSIIAFESIETALRAPLASCTARVSLADAGFTPEEVVPHRFVSRTSASHAPTHPTAAADHVDPTIPATPFDSDSTFSSFDSPVFIEVQLRRTLFPGTSGNQGEVDPPPL